MLFKYIFFLIQATKYELFVLIYKCYHIMSKIANDHTILPKSWTQFHGIFGPRNCTRPGTQYPGTWPLAVPCPGDLSNPGNVSSLFKTYPIDLVGPCHFANLEGHKANVIKARGLKNEFLHRFKTKLPQDTGIWFLLICRPMTEDIEIPKN